MSSTTYNFIYSKLVVDAEDLVGLIAYGLYKREKIEFITKFKEDNNSRDPNDTDLTVFHSLTNTDSRCSNYRSQAEGILADFSGKMLAEKARELQDVYQADLVSQLKEGLPFWKGVGQNVIASVVMLGIVAGILVLAWSFNIGPKEVASQIFQVDITPKTQTGNKPDSHHPATTPAK